MDDVKRWTRQDPRNSGRRVDMVLASDYDALRARVAELEERVADFQTALPIEAYHEDQGAVLWWRFPIFEPPYCGQPSDDGWTDDYYTHWSPLPDCRLLRASASAGGGHG